MAEPQKDQKNCQLIKKIFQKKVETSIRPKDPTKTYPSPIREDTLQTKPSPIRAEVIRHLTPAKPPLEPN